MNKPYPFTCPRCGKTSYNENDKTFGYCGNCHDWTGDEAPLRKSPGESITVNGHSYVHVAACPCRELAYEIYDPMTGAGVAVYPTREEARQAIADGGHGTEHLSLREIVVGVRDEYR